MTGLEFLRALRDGRGPRVTMMETLNYRLTEVGEGRAVFDSVPDGRTFNPLGGVHGGYYATLLDSAMGCAIHSLLDAGVTYTTLEFKLNLIRPIRPGIAVRAEGRVRHAGRRTATAEGDLSDAEGRLLAHGSTTCLILASGGGGRQGTAVPAGGASREGA